MKWFGLSQCHICKLYRCNFEFYRHKGYWIYFQSNSHLAFPWVNCIVLCKVLILSLMFLLVSLVFKVHLIIFISIYFCHNFFSQPFSTHSLTFKITGVFSVVSFEKCHLCTPVCSYLVTSVVAGSQKKKKKCCLMFKNKLNKIFRDLLKISFSRSF